MSEAANHAIFSHMVTPRYQQAGGEITQQTPIARVSVVNAMFDAAHSFRVDAAIADSKFVTT